jgi:hypothetical protein
MTDCQTFLPFSQANAYTILLYLPHPLQLRIKYHFIINDARYTSEIKFRIVMTKAAFNKKFAFTSKLNLNFKKKPVKCYIQSIEFYYVEI